MVNLLIFFRFYISRSTALAEASTGISSVCDILDIGYMFPNCSCRCSNPSQPQTVEILVNSAKHRHICLPGLREMKRCTFGKRFTVNSCQERPSSFTFRILSIHPSIYAACKMSIATISQHCASFRKHPKIIDHFSKILSCIF